MDLKALLLVPLGLAFVWLGGHLHPQEDAVGTIVVLVGIGLAAAGWFRCFGWVGGAVMLVCVVLVIVFMAAPQHYNMWSPLSIKPSMVGDYDLGNTQLAVLMLGAILAGLIALKMRAGK